jgi:hypothetical protein
LVVFLRLLKKKLQNRRMLLLVKLRPFEVRDDRDRQISQVQTLSTEIVKFKDSSEKSGSEVNNLTIKTNELEVGLYHVFFR